MKTPVLFLIFNRPDVTQRVFNAIRMAKPRQLFVSADGPRNDNRTDAEKSVQTRDIIRQVDWECDVKTLFRNENLGCRKAVSGGINWFFENVEEGIILEDDCLPHPDFFTFCESMLEKYRNEPRVMHITGGNFQNGKQRGNASYYFSGISHIWGWASWRRAWQKYDVDMKDYPEFLKKNKEHSVFSNRKAENYWLFLFKRVYNKADTWDYQWTYAVMKNGGLCIIPNVNLISNIGFGDNATHATKKNDPMANIPVHPLKEITHPEKIEANEAADYYSITQAFPVPALPIRAVRKIKKLIGKIFS